MTFRVEPMALRDYARKLCEIERVAEEADRYVTTHGTFSFHEAGLIGRAAPGHRNLMAELHELMAHLKRLGAESAKGLNAAADDYQATDLSSAAEIDATYPPVPAGYLKPYD
ncbi:hypothetical protein [Actinoplanes rectilineatus]|uniref:hypothetical protein n=1 Tax=Actinoplanes rectilineatus TaxID=113571 RepID=UPI0005F2BC01|nr:hypothetical protein [Actinoplanes rectilineatus]